LEEVGVKKPHIVLCVLWVSLLLLSASFVQAAPTDIRILYVNDFHGFAEAYVPIGSKEPLGGIAYLAAKVNELRKEKPVLLLAAGDMIQGNNWTNLFLGASVIELMNAMRFDAMVVGNHEFDFGQEVLKKGIGEAQFPVLGANVIGLPVLKPYMLREIAGVRVAVLGVTTEEAAIYTHPRNVTGLQFLSPVDAATKYIPKLRERADLIIVLSHIGYAADRSLAEKTKGIDVIVGGHSQTRVAKPAVVNGTIIVQAWEHGKALGVLDLTVEGGRITHFEGRLEDIQPKKGEEDPAVVAIVAKYREKLDSVLKERVGETGVDLDGENVRTRETNLGNLVADIMREASGADGAIINGGGIRTSIRKGEIRVGNIYSALPFNNYIVAVKLTGKQIWEALEHGVSEVEEKAGRFPQISGIAFKYSPGAQKGSRVKEVWIGNNPVDLEKEYVVATNDFLAAGGDGYKAFGDAVKASRDFSVVGGTVIGEKVVYNDPSRWVRDVVIEYIRGKKEIAPRVGGRIREVD